MCSRPNHEPRDREPQAHERSGSVATDSSTGRFGEPPFSVPTTAAGAIEAMSSLAELDLRGHTDDDLLGLFDGVEMLDRLFHAARFQLLSELDTRQLTDRRLGHVTANEAAWRHGADPKRVRADLATANTLRRHQPKLAAALSRGEVAADRVRELCRRVNDRNRDVLEAAQDELIDLCRQRSTFQQFCRDAEQIARLADADGAEPPMPRNHARLEQSGDKVSATIDLYGSEAIGFAARLRAEVDRLFRERSRDQERTPELGPPLHSELMAQAFINLVEQGAAHRHAGHRQPTADVTIVVDADAADVAHLFHDGTLLPGRGTGPVDWSQEATDITGATLRYASREWEMLTCDATFTWVIKGAGGHPVACKSGERHASRQQRRNLAFRDGRCCFPGCDAPPDWCDAHHVIRHADGGRTDMCNLALMCRRHHGVVHRRGWSMHANPDPSPGEGFFTITTATGAVLHTQHQRPPVPA